MYIYKLPHLQRRELCRLLDKDNFWEQLALKMKYDSVTLDTLKCEKSCGNSPTDELLTLWGQLNHTVLELFFLLSDLRHYAALKCLTPFVDQRYHRLIPNEDEVVAEFANININLQPKPEIRRKCQQMEKELNCSVQVSTKVNLPTTPTTDNNVTVKELNTSPNNNNKMIDMLRDREPATPKINYDELQHATHNWDEKYILGKGGFGTVYKGIWKYTKVAVKRIETRKAASEESERIQFEQSMRELYCLNMYRHDNILSLYGYSIGGQYPCLVYQYMAGGNLEQRLRTRRPDKMLNWTQRINIARGVARGLQFLHTIGTKPLIHGDIKSANILLDPSNEPKIGDFGLAREGPMSDFTHVEVSRVHGTRPYLPDEFLRAKKMSTKVDTFSFGVVLFEIGTGLSAYSEKIQYKFLKDHVMLYEGDVLELKDKNCPNDDCDNVIFFTVMQVGKECVAKRARDRPEMTEVLLKLGDSVGMSS